MNMVLNLVPFGSNRYFRNGWMQQHINEPRSMFVFCDGGETAARGMYHVLNGGDY